MHLGRVCLPFMFSMMRISYSLQWGHLWTLHSLLILRKKKINVQDMCIIVSDDLSEQCLWQLTILVQCNHRIKKWFLYIALQNKVSLAPGSSQRNVKLLQWWRKAAWLDTEMQCVHTLYFMVNVTGFWPCTIPAVVADFRTQLPWERQPHRTPHN